MKLKSLFDAILFYLSVPKCVGCGEKLSIHDRALCPSCIEKYENIKQRNCSLCAKTLDRCSCSNNFLEKHYVKKLVKVYRYLYQETTPSNNLIYSFKRDNRKDVRDFLADELADAISASCVGMENFVFVNVPRRRSSIVKYGIDHAKLLAKSLAKRFSAEYYQPIISKSKKPQKTTVGKERIRNARFKLKRRTKDLAGKTVVIVDDIVTTGASMGSCAMLIRALGTKKIIGATIAVAYKDPYTPFDISDRFSPYY